MELITIAMPLPLSTNKHRVSIRWGMLVVWDFGLDVCEIACIWTEVWLILSEVVGIKTEVEFEVS